MSHEGTMINLINRIKSDRAAKRRNQKETLNSQIDIINSPKSELKFNHEKYSLLSEEEIAERRNRIRFEIRRNSLLATIKTFVIFVSMILLLVLIWKLIK